MNKTIESLRHYQKNINIILSDNNTDILIGFTYKKGEQSQLFFADKDTKMPVGCIGSYNSGRDMLTAIGTIEATLKLLYND